MPQHGIGTPNDRTRTPVLHRIRRRTAVLSLCCLLGAPLLLLLPAARAQTPTAPAPTAATTTTTTTAAGATQVTGELTVDRDGVSEGVSGVTVTVSQDGNEVGRATSADTGVWAVPLPGPGSYTVTIDAATLPEGVFLARADETTRDVDVSAGRSRPIIFALTTQEGGETEAGGGAVEFTDVLNQIVDGIRFGLIIATASMGLSLVFGVTGLINFAHGELVTLGAIVAFVLNASFGVTLILAGLLAVGIMGAVGAGMEIGFHRPLRRRRLGNVGLIVATIGLSAFLANMYIVLFGTLPRPYETYAIQERAKIGPIEILPKDLATIVVATVALLAVALVLQRTRLGTAMRAVADNHDLASASGINTDRVVLHTWILGTMLAALGGILLGIGQKVQWNMGFNLLLLMFAAVVVGGLGTAYGPILGGLLLGIVTQVSTLWFDTEFKFVFALATLILMLLFRPQGIMGRRERIG